MADTALQKAPKPDTTGLETYVVLTDAVNVATGRVNAQTKKPESVRLLRGERIQAPADHPSIQTLLGLRAVAQEAKVAGKDVRTTARHIRAVFARAGEHYIAPVVEAVQPVPAPAGDAVPADALTVADLHRSEQQ
jgi:hypothetical protein